MSESSRRTDAAASSVNEGEPGAESVPDDTADADQQPDPSADGDAAAEASDHSAVEGSTEQPPEETLPLDQVFGILKNKRRRHVLKFLQSSDGEVSLSDVAEQIAAWENDKEIREISSSERKRVYVGLYQCHLPKMDGMDIIAFNKPRGLIELGPNAEVLFKYLDTEDGGRTQPWHVYSVALSVTGALVLAIALVGDSLTALPVLEFAVVALIAALGAYSVLYMHWLDVHGPDEPAEA